MEKALRAYFGLFFLLAVFGMVMVFNIRVFTVSQPEAQVYSILRAQVLNFVMASLGFAAAYLINLDTMRSWIRFLLLAIFLLLFATFIIGTEVNGSKRWINLHFMMLQPSEFAKLVAVFYLAEVVTNKRDKLGLLQELIYPFVMVSFLVIVIAVEDLGTGLIIFSVAVVLFLMGGMRLKYFTVLAGLASLVLVVLILMKPYRLERIQVWMDPWKYKQGKGYQQVQSEIAMGRGGVSGVGFGNSQRKLRYLPEAHTDFIYAIVGEEFGFIGSVTLLGIYLALFLLGIYFALDRSSLFHFYLISGFVLMLAIQSAINMGVVTSTLPNKGVPLPFVSYGGSSLLASAMMIGFIMNAAVTDSKYIQHY